MASQSSAGNVHILANLAVFRGQSAAGLPPLIFLRGTTTPLDGGQGFYSPSYTDKTTADNGTTCIVDGGGFRWFLVSDITAAQIVASLSNNGTTPALDPILPSNTTIAAATTTDLSTLTQITASVTGNGVSISSLGTLHAGPIRILTFADVNTLVYDATALLLPGAANITTAANDVAGFISLGSGNWQCLFYTEAAGGAGGVTPINRGGTGQTTSVAAFDALAAQGANVTAAATTNIGAATGPVIAITGNTTITSFGTKTAGTLRWVRFTGTPLLTYDGTALILPGSANIQAAAGDSALFESLGSGNWQCLWYQRRNALPIVTTPIASGGTGAITSVTAYDALSAQGADIASASTTDLSTATGPYVNVTGNTTITALGTATAGITRRVKFTGTPLITYNATSLILPGAVNIQAAANDSATFVSLGSGNWICTAYQVAAAEVYSEGTWTPTFAAATPGDLNIVYSVRVGTWMRFGNMVVANFSFNTSTFTWTTASGTVTITGLPFTAKNVTNDFHISGLSFQGITKATYTQFGAITIPNTTTAQIAASGTAVSATSCVIADFPTVGNVILRGTIIYQAV